MFLLALVTSVNLFANNYVPIAERFYSENEAEIYNYVSSNAYKAMNVGSEIALFKALVDKDATVQSFAVDVKEDFRAYSPTWCEVKNTLVLKTSTGKSSKIIKVGYTSSLNGVERCRVTLGLK